MMNNKKQLPMDLLPEWIFYEAWGPSLEDLLYVCEPVPAGEQMETIAS